MDKELLIRVLGTNSRVVIPSFGAFLRKQQSDTLVFSPFLKNDDGFLSTIVSEEYGISDDDARSMVAAFAEHIASVLRARSKYYIDGVGTLIVDDNGAVSFVMDTTRQIPPSQPSAAPIPEPVQPQPQPQPQRQPVAQQPISQQPINVRPVAPQPISAARPAYTPPTPVQAPPAPTPVRPVVQTRPINSGGFARPTSMAAPIAQPQQIQQPQPAQQPRAEQQPQSVPTPNGAKPTGGRPMNRSAVGAGSNNNRHRPATRNKGKNDVWLVVAIIAALVVIVLMVVGILTTNEASNFKL